jgi:hypothetical protein
MARLTRNPGTGTLHGSSMIEVAKDWPLELCLTARYADGVVAEQPLNPEDYWSAVGRDYLWNMAERLRRLAWEHRGGDQ